MRLRGEPGQTYDVWQMHDLCKSHICACQGCKALQGWLHILWKAQLSQKAACSLMTARITGVQASGQALRTHTAACLPQVAAFSEMLREHQRAKTADGTTVLEKAVIEHNLAAGSKLYMNIGTSELGALLGTSGPKAEEIAARMISEGRLQVCGPHLPLWLCR